MRTQAIPDISCLACGSRPATQSQTHESQPLNSKLRKLLSPNSARTVQTILAWVLELLHMGGCQNYGPFLGTQIIRCRMIIRIQKRDHNFDNHPYIRQLAYNPDQLPRTMHRASVENCRSFANTKTCYHNKFSECSKPFEPSVYVELLLHLCVVMSPFFPFMW